MGVALGFASAPSGARAASWGFANSNVDQYYQAESDNGSGYGPTDADQDFWALTHQSALGPARYQRFLVPWEIAGTFDPVYSANADSQGCVGPTTFADAQHDDSLSGLINALAAAEEAGFTPVIALDHDNVNNAKGDTVGIDFQAAYDSSGELTDNGYQWPYGAEVGTNPTDWDMYCATKLLGEDLSDWGVLPSSTYFESYNEPQNASAALSGYACFGYAPPNTDSADCAARYFADVVSGLAWANFPSYATNVIAGTFTHLTDQDGGAGFSPANACNNQPSWNAGYVCYIERGDSNVGIPPDSNSLSSYVGYVHNWAFHDYDDVGASNWCYFDGPAGGCVTESFQNMIGLMRNSSAPGGSNLWMTEAGCRGPGSPGLCQSQADPNEIGNEAYDWVQLAEDNPQVNMFWYEYYPDPYWDSALEYDDGAARQALCVIGSGGVEGDNGIGVTGQTWWNGINCGNT